MFFSPLRSSNFLIKNDLQNRSRMIYYDRTFGANKIRINTALSYVE